MIYLSTSTNSQHTKSLRFCFKNLIYSLQLTMLMYIVLHPLYNVQCSMYNFALYNKQCTWYIVHCTVTMQIHVVQLRLWLSRIKCTVYILKCKVIVYIVQSRVHIVNFTVFIVFVKISSNIVFQLKNFQKNI